VADKEIIQVKMHSIVLSVNFIV